MEDEVVDEVKSDPVGQNMADIILDLQNKYEAEHQARLDAEKANADLTKVIRTMSVQRVEEPAEEVKPQSLDDAVDNLF